MKQVLLATLLSAFVCPGAGQLLNKEIVKGWLLIGVSGLAVVSFTINLSSRLNALLASDISQMDAAVVRSAMEEIMKNPPAYFRYFNFFMMALWVYGVVDAFLGARVRWEAEEKTFPGNGPEGSA